METENEKGWKVKRKKKSDKIRENIGKQREKKKDDMNRSKDIVIFVLSHDFNDFYFYPRMFVDR